MADRDEVIQGLEYTFEYIVEQIDGRFGNYLIPFDDVPSFKYMIDQIVAATNADRAQVIEGLERWKSGIRRKYG